MTKHLNNISTSHLTIIILIYIYNTKMNSKLEYNVYLKLTMQSFEIVESKVTFNKYLLVVCPGAKGTMIANDYMKGNGYTTHV